MNFLEILEGLNIFAKYDNPYFSPDCDEVYAGCDGVISGEDIAKLKVLNWTMDPHMESWVHVRSSHV